MNNEIISSAARNALKRFLKDTYGCEFSETHYNGLDNKEFGDYCYESGHLKINVDYKYSENPNLSKVISLELTDYKDETWLINDNINLLVFETTSQIVILSHEKMKRLAKTCLIADYGNGKGFFDTSTHIGRNKHFIVLSKAHFENVEPLQLSCETMNSIRDFVECHSPRGACVASVKIALLERENLIEGRYAKRRKV